MRIIRKSRLFFQDGGSDKIYEVDLCDLGSKAGKNRYVVNFRYGRRGKKLRESTKTVSPVELNEANQIFDSVVVSKINKKYQESEASTPSTGTVGTSDNNNQSLAESKLMEHLDAAMQDALTDDQTKRLIWRVGERHMRQAAGKVASFALKQDLLMDYCVAWSLGRCGDPSFAPVLVQIQKQHGLNYVGRIAREAWMHIADKSETTAEMQVIKEALPASIAQAVESQDPERILLSLEMMLQSPSGQIVGILADLYTLSRDNEALHTALVRIIRTIPLKAGIFKAVRQIFKQAEFRADSVLFAVASYRFETERATFWRSPYGNHVLDQDSYTYVRFDEEIVKENSRLAYSNNTRDYLRLRCWRTLRKMAALDNEAYITHATDILLQYADADGIKPWELSWYNWEDRRNITRHFDSFSHYLIFNYILELNSPRVKLTSSGNKWYVDTDVVEIKAFRAEAYPEMWDQFPEKIVRLLSFSQCEPVHKFAVRALREQKEFCANLSIETIILFLAKPYAGTSELGLELAKLKISQGDLSIALLEALVDSPLSKARELALDTLKSDKTWLTQDNALLFSCITSQHEDVRLWVRRIATELDLPKETIQALFGRLIAHVMALAKDKTDEQSKPIIEDIGWILKNVFTVQAQTLSLSVIEDLLAHEADSIQALGAALLLGHQTPAEQLPSSIFITLLGAASAEVRALGVQLFSQLADETLLQQPDLVVSLAVSVDAEVRNAARPMIGRLAKNNLEFAKAALARLLNYLFRSEPAEGFHDDILLLMEKELHHVSQEVNLDMTWRLLQAKTKAAKRYGAYVLQKYSPADYSVRQVARLGGHSILSVRQWAWNGFNQDVERIKANAQDALVLFDNDWQDGRAFAFEFFNKQFTAEDWTADLLISICDSVRPEIQDFGRDLINQYFTEDDAVEYLLKLSEHPSDNLQLFVTNYLRQYAANDIERLKKLMPYFLTVLSKVNRARAAKTRVTEFLMQESRISNEAAHFVANIFTRQSATTAMIDKSAAIQILLEIQWVHADIETPITIKAPTALSSMSEV